MRTLDSMDYLADPHSALAWKALQDRLAEDETGVFLCTAHPAKFRETLEAALNRSIPLPEELQAVAEKEVLSAVMPADFALLKEFLIRE